MQLLSDIVRDTEENFGLGNKAVVLVSEAAKSLFDARHGGLKGFLVRLEEEGLGSDLDNWRDPQQEIRFPDGIWVDTVLGTESITRIGRDLGMANARVRTALAYVIPHLIRYFTAGSGLPEHLPHAVEEFFSGGRFDHLAPRSRAIKKTGRGRKRHRGASRAGFGQLFWAGGVIALLVSGFFLGQDILSRKAPAGGDTSAMPPIAETAPNAPVSEDHKAIDPSPTETRILGSKLEIRSYGNQIEYLGFVNSQEARVQLIDKLQRSFGVPRLNGEVIVESERAEPQWIGPLDRLLPLFNVPGLDVRLEGNTVRVGGWLAEEDRTSVLNNLMSALGASFRFGYLRDEDTERAQDSRQFILAALTPISADAKPQDVISILNRWVINFPEGSSAFPEESRELATRIAEVMKGLKVQAVIEIQGHVDAETSSAATQRLSLERANAVRDALIKAGFPSSQLRTKGYGSEKKLSTGTAPFDHARNERVEFRVIQVCDPYFPCEATQPTKRLPQPDPNVPDLPSSREGANSTEGVVLETPVRVKPSMAQPDVSLPPEGTSGRPASAAGNYNTEESDAAGSRPSKGSRLKALEEELPPPPKPRPKPPATVKPADPKSPEWYDPLGLF